MPWKFSFINSCTVRVGIQPKMWEGYPKVHRDMFLARNLGVVKDFPRESTSRKCIERNCCLRLEGGVLMFVGFLGRFNGRFRFAIGRVDGKDCLEFSRSSLEVFAAHKEFSDLQMVRDLSQLRGGELRSSRRGPSIGSCSRRFD